MARDHAREASATSHRTVLDALRAPNRFVVITLLSRPARNHERPPSSPSADDQSLIERHGLRHDCKVWQNSGEDFPAIAEVARRNRRDDEQEFASLAQPTDRVEFPANAG